MKKIFSLPIILGLTYACFLFFKMDNKPTYKSESALILPAKSLPITTSQEIRIEHQYSYLDTRILQHSRWSDFKNYTSQSEFLYKNPTEIVELIRNVIKEVSACLKKNLCGQKKSATSPYFDANHTEAHDLIERALSLLVEMKEEKLSEYQDITKEELLEVIRIDNEAIQGLGLELILTKSPSGIELNELVKRVEDFNSNVLGPAYGMLYSVMKESNTERQLLLASVEKSLKSSDSFRSIELAKNLKHLELNQNEFEEMLKSSCEKTRESHNQKALEFYIKDAAKNHHYQLTTKCS